MNKTVKTVGLVLGWILAILVVALLTVRIGVSMKYVGYFDHADPVFAIPGLWSGFVPQGFDYVEEADAYLISGYMDDGGPSRVYVRDANGKTFFVELYGSDGVPYTRHCGGICHNGDYFYIAGANGVEVFRLNDLLEGRDTAQIGTIETGFRVSYCSFAQGKLYAGNFYHEGNYETPAEHHLTTPAGEQNAGVIAVFQGNETAEFGIDPTPVAAISTPGLVQGVCLTDDGRIVLSCSYSLSSGHLYTHTLPQSNGDTLQILDAQVPLSYLDNTTLESSVELPPMNEEIIFRDGKVLVLTESGCMKYFYGKITRGTRVYAYALPEA